MLEQLINLVKQSGQETVIQNQEIPNEYNSEILSEATKTITSGFQNILAGGGLQNILDLFKGGTQSQNGNAGIGGLLKNPIVTMMIGYFINKLVSKYKMAPAAANNVAQSVIPNVLNSLISKTTDLSPENDAFDFNDLISSLSGGKIATAENGNGFDFQGLLNQFVGNGGSNRSSGFDLQDIIQQVSGGMQETRGDSHSSGGGFLNLVKDFLSR